MYHIGLPLHHGDTDILIEISMAGSTQKRILSLPNLKYNLINDPDLSSISPTLLPQVLQTLYVVTGCDYISFFSGLGKTTLMKCSCQHAEFITGGTNYPGGLSQCALDTDEHEMGFLSLLRLIGTAYFKRYASAFTATTPQSHYNAFSPLDGHVPIKQQHINWLEDIRNNIWDRTQFENNMIPSVDALYRHWLRSCWVLDMWAQANSNEIILKPLLLYAWKRSDGKLQFDWDSDTNIQRVQTRVQGLLKGCKCTKGCRTNACGCKRRGQTCKEGCQCIGCVNLSHSYCEMNSLLAPSGSRERGQDLAENTDSEDKDEYDSDVTVDEEDLDAEVNEIMRNVFGDNFDSSEEI